MSVVLDYIEWRGDLSFQQSPFNEIDALILSQLSYLNSAPFVSSAFDQKISYKDLYCCFETADYFLEETNTRAVSNAKSLELFHVVGKTERFGNIKVCGFERKQSESQGEQFGAVTNIIGDGTVFVAFRGTDNSIVGLEEDFNLAIMDEIPSQRDACSYLKKAIAALGDTFRFRVGGHSKGGNAAIFAAAYLDSEEKKSLEKIYNYDGPGFSQKRLDSEEFRSIMPLVQSFYPKFSMIGMLFENNSAYQVIDTDAVLIFQHDLLSWHVKGTHFVTCEGFESGSELFGDTFNDWYASVDAEQRVAFIHAMFRVMEASGAKTFLEFADHFGRNALTTLDALNNVDPDTRRAIILCFKALFKAAGDNYFGY